MDGIDQCGGADPVLARDRYEEPEDREQFDWGGGDAGRKEDCRQPRLCPRPGGQAQAVSSVAITRRVVAEKLGEAVVQPKAKLPKGGAGAQEDERGEGNGDDHAPPPVLPPTSTSCGTRFR